MTKTAFITGGSSGIGLAIAQALALRHPDIRLALFARDHTRLAAAVADLSVAAPKADIRVFAVDLAEADAAKAAIDAAVQGLGPPDILILSAGMTFPARWKRSAWRRTAPSWRSISLPVFQSSPNLRR